MANYRHWFVSLWRDPDYVPHCRIPSSDKTEWLISTTLCGWRCCFMAYQLWFMTRIRKEEEEDQQYFVLTHVLVMDKSAQSVELVLVGRFSVVCVLTSSITVTLTVLSRPVFTTSNSSRILDFETSPAISDKSFGYNEQNLCLVLDSRAVKWTR